MDTALPGQWDALCLLVFLLGLRHGFDADHLVAIDGLARVNAATRPLLARACGALFSLGHGAVVCAIAVAVGATRQQWNLPQWLDTLGNGISILMLLGLGLANLWVALSASSGQANGPVGFKARLLGPLARIAGPHGVLMVGAIFAVSFDTLSQTAMFSMAALQFGGARHALMLAGLFVLGMLVTDGLNGLWIARLLRRAGRDASMAARVLGAVVGTLGLLVAAWEGARLTLPTFASWSEGRDLALAVTVIGAVMLASFAVRGVRIDASRLPQSTNGHRSGPGCHPPLA